MYNRTIGERLKTERERLWLSLDEISNTTKINKKYLEAIEDNSFESFSSHTQAIGFIKNYSHALNIDPTNLIAIYKRDFEAEKLLRKINKVDDEELLKAKKPTKLQKLRKIQITSRRAWMTISVVFIFVFIVLTSGFIKNAFAPPYFKINLPLELYGGENKTFNTTEKTIQIKGETSSYTLIKINEMPLVLSSGFTFESENIPITSEDTRFIITAESQLGVKSMAVLNIKREDIQKRNAKKTVTLSSNLSGVFVTATVDNVIQYNDIVTDQSVINLLVSQSFQIETDNYSPIFLKYNNLNYQLRGNVSKFTINDAGELIQQ